VFTTALFWLPRVAHLPSERFKETRLTSPSRLCPAFLAQEAPAKWRSTMMRQEEEGTLISSYSVINELMQGRRKIPALNSHRGKSKSGSSSMFL
jgi:hypothetical protein